MSLDERYEFAERIAERSSWAIMRAQLAGATENDVERLREVYRVNALAAQVLCEQCGAARRVREKAEEQFE